MGFGPGPKSDAGEATRTMPGRVYLLDMAFARARRPAEALDQPEEASGPSKPSERL
jgi:hypothetical protein